MKKLFGFFVVLVVAASMLVANVSAASRVAISINHAYLKSNATYDVVVKAQPGSRLALYVNDKNPIFATANQKQWATFHQVGIPDAAKLSFTNVLSTKGKLYQKPINYVRYSQVENSAVAFLSTSPNKPVVTAAPTPTVSTPAPQTVTPAPTPQPACTNGSYVNSVGNTVCSPESTPSQPAGATAQCGDGTYSFSQSRSGTCSHHGGVATWL